MQSGDAFTLFPFFFKALTEAAFGVNDELTFRDGERESESLCAVVGGSVCKEEEEEEEEEKEEEKEEEEERAFHTR